MESKEDARANRTVGAADGNLSRVRAFNNQYWPALFFVDPRGGIRQKYFGEGEYEGSERNTFSDYCLTPVLQASAVASYRSTGTAWKPRLIRPTCDRPNVLGLRTHCQLRLARRASRHGSVAARNPIRFRVTLDGQPTGTAQGVDVDEGRNEMLQNGGRIS
jgi:hypothetical protein